MVRLNYSKSADSDYLWEFLGPKMAFNLGTAMIVAPLCAIIIYHVARWLPGTQRGQDWKGRYPGVFDWG